MDRAAYRQDCGPWRQVSQRAILSIDTNVLLSSLALTEALGMTGIYTFDRKMNRYPGVARIEP
ncbi:MAG TPA: hypothetical protein VD767_04985 [Thermomicrobiales bacterium]|nr:hypothetical protein [Thermomicrobiales bacterium]